MYVRMRLYLCHDYDLFRIYFSKELDFKNILKTIIRSYSQGKYYQISVPETEKNHERYPARVTFNLTLNDKKDKDLIEFLSHIVDKQRNGFLKNLMRMYLCSVNAYLVDDIYLMDHTDNIHQVDAFTKRSKNNKQKKNISIRAEPELLKQKEPAKIKNAPNTEKAGKTGDAQFMAFQKMLENF